jgi:hypothetical protein
MDFLNNFREALPFTALCFIFSMIFIILDLIFLKFRNKSILGIKWEFKFKNVISNIMLWPIGASLVGLICGTIHLFNMENMLGSAVAIAVAWPFIVVNKIKK